MKAATISLPQFPEGQWGDYHMVIAPWAFSFPSLSSYYQEISGVGEVILDNGAFEGRQLKDPQILYHAAKQVNATLLVLPDVLYKPSETLEASRTLVEAIKDDPFVKRVMFVPQSIDQSTWLNCLSAWLAYWENNNLNDVFDLVIGIIAPRPHLMVKQKVSGKPFRRTDLLEALYQSEYPLHLLGVPAMDVFCTEELEYWNHPKLVGVDTSYGAALAVEGAILRPWSPKAPLHDPYKPVRGGMAPRLKVITLLNSMLFKWWCRTGDPKRVIPKPFLRAAYAQIIPGETYHFEVAANFVFGEGAWEADDTLIMLRVDHEHNQT